MKLVLCILLNERWVVVFLNVSICLNGIFNFFVDLEIGMGDCDSRGDERIRDSIKNIIDL